MPQRKIDQMSENRPRYYCLFWNLKTNHRNFFLYSFKTNFLIFNRKQEQIFMACNFEDQGSLGGSFFLLGLWLMEKFFTSARISLLISVVCKGGGESTNQLFLHCTISRRLWSIVSALFGVSWFMLNSLNDLLAWWNSILICLVWCSWMSVILGCSIISGGLIASIKKSNFLDPCLIGWICIPPVYQRFAPFFPKNSLLFYKNQKK